MTLAEMKKKVLALIEELNPNSALLTDDPDISTKHNDVINQIMFELCRIKKLPKYVELDVDADDILDYDKIGSKVGADIYQLGTVGGVKHTMKASGTIIKVQESGVLEVECFVYPEAVKATTPDTYVFDIPADLLEIMPYGVAADLLKSDISTEYGSIYAERYESMLARVDTRYNAASLYVDGGWDI